MFENGLVPFTSEENTGEMRLRSRKQYASPNTRAVAGDVVSTSASASKKRRTEKKTTTTTTDEDENEDVVVAKQIEKQQQKKRRGLPDELWDKILESVDDNSVLAFACVSKQLRRVWRRSGRRLKTNMKGYSTSSFKGDLYLFGYEELSSVSEEWCLWTMSFLSVGRQQKKRRQIMNAAAFSGHLGALKYWKAHAKKRLFDEFTCAFAALGGQMEVLVWLRENNYPWDWRICEAAARGGHLEVLKYGKEHGRDWDEWACSGAARGGHLELLKYLYEHGCRWDEETCYAAARGGHLEVLKYAHEQGCPWNEWTCQYAAKGGHLDVLKYAHEKGCPWNEWTCQYAADSLHFEVLKYARDTD